MDPYSSDRPRSRSPPRGYGDRDRRPYDSRGGYPDRGYGGGYGPRDRGGYDRGYDRPRYDRPYERDRYGPPRGYDRGYDRGGYDRGYDRGYGGGGYDRGYGGGYDRRGPGGYDRRGPAGYDDRRRAGPPMRRNKPVIRGSEEERKNSTTLYIGNVPYSFVEKDVQSMFESFGTIRKISIPIDRFTQRNKGFVFVEYEERRDAEEAKTKYENYEVEGRRLRIDWDVGLSRKEEATQGGSATNASDPAGSGDAGASSSEMNVDNGEEESRASPRYSPVPEPRRSQSPEGPL